MHHLRHLEINAHTDLSPGSWSASHLLDIRSSLQSVSLILPDRNIAAILPDFLARQREISTSDNLDLRSITILCRDSPVFNDRVLTACHPLLKGSNLESLSIAGASRLSGEPLLALLPTLPALRHLAIEATNVQPDYLRRFAPYLTSLVSLKLTHPGPEAPSATVFFPALSDLLRSTTNLQSFTLYHSGAGSTGSRIWPLVQPDFVEDVVETIGPKLRKFEVSNVLMLTHSAELLAYRALGLRDLVVHLAHDLTSVRPRRASRSCQ